MQQKMGKIGKTCRYWTPSNPLCLSVLVCMLLTCRVDCGENDYRICITTDIENGVSVQCQSEDKTIEKLPRKVMPKDLSYTYALDNTSPLFFSYFHCTVTNHDGNTMTFAAFDKKFTEKPWKFLLHNDMREIRWSVNHVGAWVWMKGRPQADSIMKWQFVDFWPPWPPVLPPSNQSGPSNWYQLEQDTLEPVRLKPRILLPIYTPDFIMKRFEDPLHVLLWYMKGPWKQI